LAIKLITVRKTAIEGGEIWLLLSMTC